MRSCLFAVAVAFVVVHVAAQTPFDEPQQTLKGCTCLNSGCAATLSQGLANCDWCYTAANCGRSGLLGTWDYCAYPALPKFEAQNAKQKLDYLWLRITADTASGTYPNVLKALDESVQTTFDNGMDWFPAKRVKVIHSIGAVCRFTFVAAADSLYTGLLAPGAVSAGLIRLGSALAVDATTGIVPGVGVKFLRSGVPSANFVALFSLGTQPGMSYNFFEHNLTNHIPPATGAAQILGQKFAQASGCITQVGLSDVCAFGPNGEKAIAPVFPFRVALVPGSYQLPSTPMAQAQLQAYLAAIPPNTPVYDLYAWASPADVKRGAGAATKLGSIVTQAACTNSKFGDTQLFFRHQRIEDDWRVRPEWLPQLDPRADCSTSSALTATPPSQCSSL